jgi:cytochrome c oxidase assembly factor CtaG/cytochrome c2
MMIALSLFATAWFYIRGVRAAWSRAGAGRGVTRRHAALFSIGLVTIAIALLSPLDAMADDLFAAHMTQHVLLAEVAPPFLVFGAPLAAFTWALPAGRRRGVVAFLRRRSRFRALWRTLTAPAVGWIVHLIAIWIWHAPSLYALALRHETIHALEHLSFVGTAVLLWWPIAHPRTARRTAYGAGLGTIFLTTMQTGVLGALITLSHRLLYPLQARGAAQWGLSPMDDQTIAGLIMWVPGGLIYVAAMSVLFLKWLQPPSRVREPVKLAPALAPIALVVLFVQASSCARPTQSAVAGGSVERGKTAVEAMGCGACHTIPGVPNAHGEVGPPLTDIARRSIIAGELANTPENMMRWIENPQAVEPTTAMPNLGVNAQSARDITAYLYTLR